MVVVVMVVVEIVVAAAAAVLSNFWKIIIHLYLFMLFLSLFVDAL